jgi:uncharacterized protein (DUF4415 family)
MRRTKSLTTIERRRQLKAIADLPDTRIDTSDIPQLTVEQMRRAVRGEWYRPIKKPITIRLDMDVIEWLKKDGRGYQTKANHLLRTEMLRSLRKKEVQRAPNHPKRKKAGES